MTVKKVNLFAFYFFLLVLAILAWLAFKMNTLDWHPLFAMFIILLAIWGIGCFLGIVLSVIIRRPSSEPYLYLVSHISVMLTAAIFIVGGWHLGEKRPNEEANHSLVNFDQSMPESPSRSYVRTAFLHLETQFDNSNSFLLERYQTRWKVLSTDSTVDTLYSVYFAYLKDEKLLFARVYVLHDTAVIDKINATTPLDQYVQSTHAGVWARRGSLEDVRKEMKNLPDSTRAKVMEAMEK